MEGVAQRPVREIEERKLILTRREFEAEYKQDQIIELLRDLAISGRQTIINTREIGSVSTGDDSANKVITIETEKVKKSGFLQNIKLIVGIIVGLTIIAGFIINHFLDDVSKETIPPEKTQIQQEETKPKEIYDADSIPDSLKLSDTKVDSSL